jgi:hypothetical protein
VQKNLRKGKNKAISSNRFIFSWIPLILILGAHLLSYSKNIQGINSTTNILPDDDFNYSFEEIGQYLNRFGAPIDIAIQGDLAFVVCEWGGLLIFNISNPTNPILLSTYTDSCMITETNACIDEATIGVEVTNDIVVFAYAKTGLLLINVSNPTQPFLQGKYSRYLYDVKLHDNFAYLLCPGNQAINYGDVIQIVDISDATNPIFIGELDYSLIGGFLWDICINNNYIFSPSAGELIVIDITTPSLPEEITRLDINGADIVVPYKDYILAGNSTTLKIVDVHTPSAPILIKELPLSMGDITSICTSNDTIYIADFSHPKIIAINVTDIENPTQISTIQNYTTIGNSWKALAYKTTMDSDNLLYCSDYRLGLFCFNVTNSSDIVLIGSFDTNCKTTAITVDSDYVYLCSRREGPYYPSRLEIISIANKSKPVLVGKHDFQKDTLRHIVVSSGLAFLSLAAGGLVIMNISNPAQPMLLGSYDHNATVGFFENLWYDSTTQLVYITHPYYDLLIINCSNPTTPTLVSTFEIGEPFYMSNLFIEDEVAYLTSSGSEGSLALVNVSTPQEPTLLSWTTVGDAIMDIQILEHRAYLVMQYNYLAIIDVSTPTAPSKVSSLKNWWFQTQTLFVNNSKVFIAQYAAGLRVVDTSNPANPVEIAAIRDHYRGICYDVVVQGAYIFIADGWDGLEIYQLVESAKLPKRVIILISIIVPSGVITITLIAVLTMKSKRKGKSVYQ